MRIFKNILRAINYLLLWICLIFVTSSLVAHGCPSEEHNTQPKQDAEGVGDVLLQDAEGVGDVEEESLAIVDTDKIEILSEIYSNVEDFDNTQMFDIKYLHISENNEQKLRKRIFFAQNLEKLRFSEFDFSNTNTFYAGEEDTKSFIENLDTLFKLDEVNVEFSTVTSELMKNLANRPMKNINFINNFSRYPIEVIENSPIKIAIERQKIVTSIEEVCSNKSACQKIDKNSLDDKKIKQILEKAYQNHIFKNLSHNKNSSTWEVYYKEKKQGYLDLSHNSRPIDSHYDSSENPNRNDKHNKTKIFEVSRKNIDKLSPKIFYKTSNILRSQEANFDQIANMLSINKEEESYPKEIILDLSLLSFKELQDKFSELKNIDHGWQKGEKEVNIVLYNFIENVSRINLNTLNLSNCSLKEIPPSILKLENLTYLDLSYNKITEIPPAAELKNSLHTLYLDNNFIKSISSVETSDPFIYVRNQIVTGDKYLINFGNIADILLQNLLYGNINCYKTVGKGGIIYKFLYSSIGEPTNHIEFDGRVIASDISFDTSEKLKEAIRCKYICDNFLDENTSYLLDKAYFSVTEHIRNTYLCGNVNFSNIALDTVLDFKYFSGAVSLYISNCGIENIVNIAEAKNLINLDLSNNKVNHLMKKIVSELNLLRFSI